MSAARMIAGTTPSGATKWQTYTGECIYVDIDTSAGGFQHTPAYLTSIGGGEDHWATIGATSIYPIPPATSPTAAGFRLYVRWKNGAPLAPKEANDRGWFVNWVGIEGDPAAKNG